MNTSFSHNAPLPLKAVPYVYIRHITDPFTKYPEWAQKLDLASWEWIGVAFGQDEYVCFVHPDDVHNYPK